VSLLTDNGSTKDDLKLPTDDSLLTQIKDGFAEGKDLVVSVMSAMGEEQICALKDIGSNLSYACVRNKLDKMETALSLNLMKA
ncbi:eukaryotic translation initiation factor 5a-2-like protein, partial [Trifolium pratense]